MVSGEEHAGEHAVVSLSLTTAQKGKQRQGRPHLVFPLVRREQA
jgi:hypothetical protein